MNHWRNIFYSFMIFAGIFTLSVLIQKTQQIGENEAIDAIIKLDKARLTNVSQLLKVHFESYIRERRIALISLSQGFLDNPRISKDRFLSHAKSLRESIDGLDSIYYISRDRDTTWTSTEIGNLYLELTDFSVDGKMNRWLVSSREIEEHTNSDILRLQLNEFALMIIQPVFSEDEFIGWVCGVIPIKKIIESRFDESQQNPFFLVIQYVKNNETIYGNPEDLVFSGDRLGYESLTLGLPDELNTLIIKIGINPLHNPLPETTSNKPSPILLLGLLISLVSAVFTFLILTRNDKLEQEVCERVKDVESSQEELQAIIERAPMAILGYDQSLQIFLWNPMCNRIFGYNQEEAIGRPVHSIVATMENNEIREIISSKVFEEATIQNLSWETRRKDGRIIMCGGSSTNVYHDNSGHRFALLICNDVTKQRAMESELKNHTEHLEQLVSERTGELADSEAKHRQLLSTAKDAIVGVDHDQKITLFNFSAERTFGYAASEIIGKSIWEIIPRTDPSNPASGLAPFLQGGHTERVGMTREVEGMRRNQETFPMEISLSVFSRNGQPEFTAIIRDISERKKIDLKIEDMIRDLRHANQEMEEFTYVVSHDMKAPLRAVKNMSQFLIEDYSEALDDLGLDYLNRLQDSTKTMSEMIDKLLELTQISLQKTQMVTAKSSSIVDKVISVLKVPENVTIRYSKSLPLIQCAPAKIEQVFLNLISNGIKYNNNNKKIIEIDHETKGNDYVFMVKDNGIGIDKSYHFRIFQPFQRLHKRNEYEGTGIGLSIVKKIILDHGGRIWIDSEVGEGTIFYFTIPKVQVEELV